jgi:hypothetical protein
VSQNLEEKILTQDLFSYLPPVTTLDTRVPRRCFRDPYHRLVVSVLLFDHGEIVFLTEPRHAPHDRDWLVPVQEKVKRRVDHTLGAAVRRGLREELRQPPRAITLHPTELYRYTNHVPERRGKPPMTKHILVFGAYVPSINDFPRPNQSEVRRVIAVGPNDLLDCLPPRPEKFCGVIDACRAAAEIGFLSRERWGSTLMI